MVSAISEYATDSVVLEGKDRVQKVSGKLAANYKPGAIVYQTAVDTWTQIGGTVSDNRDGARVGVLEFRKRTSTTFGEMDIDQAYTYGTKENVEIIIGPQDGTIKVAVFNKDIGAAKYFGHPLTGSSGGKVESRAAKYSSRIVGFITEDGYDNGDTVLKMYLAGGY